ncbi:hypothetical protein BRYFOR_08900 [Marvinbryantia formatexigens DSM 14469]|uniref:Spore germination protein n=3 Tax=Marvinbryantia TaxID=248744 RepID=C6LJR3_9FIRM|nr:hypothetical protein BRYFOR_08900 [Marvinbryantia formatexigens DSM 14469]SDG12642.1 spore germination protein [Marvinbryantia formatexigens]
MDRIKRERFCTVLSFFDVMHTKKILVDVLVLPGIRRMMQYIDYNSDRRKSMEIPKAEGEKNIRGSREAFTEDIGTNISLIEKRIRDGALTQEKWVLGRRTKTEAVLLYLEGVAYGKILEQVRTKLRVPDIDSVMDGGMLEQLMKENVWSPFPQCQASERPDRTAQALLEGRAAILLDHSPEALILPATVNSMFQTGDDYYRHFMVVSFLRLIRYLAAFLAAFLPGLYVAASCYHTQLLPTNLILSLAEARAGVPFPVLLEVLLMELAFELIREAGLRMPGAIGNTIGIVGGLIIGQSAVSANLVSPMTVVVVALTALGSFSVPNEEFSEALRLIKYVNVFLGGALGIVGIALGGYFLALHLTRLQSFGVPYLNPFAMPEVNDAYDLRDSLLRWPMRTLQRRPLFAWHRQRVRMRQKEGDNARK